MTITTEQAQSLSTSGKVFASDGDKVGSIAQIYLDNSNGLPTWVTVKTGLFGTSESFVPLDGARIDGDDVHIAFDKARVKDAPRVDPDTDLTPAEEERLYMYYGMLDSHPVGDDAASSDDSAQDNIADSTVSESDRDVASTETADRGRAAEETQGHPGAVGRDTSGPTTDEAMTRSEEQVNVGTRTRETGRARLRKYVVTDTVTQTVPLRHEEVTLEREPITADNYDAAQAGPAISEEEHEVTLHEEVPVVEKEAVAVERVRLGAETVTEDTTVSEDVRKEQIEMQDPESVPDSTTGRDTTGRDTTGRDTTGRDTTSRD